MNRFGKRALFITAIVTFVVTSAIWIGVGAAGYHLLFRDPPGFEVTVDQPESVELGDRFSLTIRVANPTGKPIRLGSIDAYDDLLDGFEVLSTDPKPDSKQRLLGFTSYYFKESIPPSGDFTFRLDLRAKEAGDWGGDIDCCTPGGNFVTHYTEIGVIDPALEADQIETSGNAPPSPHDASRK